MSTGCIINRLREEEERKRHDASKPSESTGLTKKSLKAERDERGEDRVIFRDEI